MLARSQQRVKSNAERKEKGGKGPASDSGGLLPSRKPKKK